MAAFWTEINERNGKAKLERIAVLGKPYEQPLDPPEPLLDVLTGEVAPASARHLHSSCYGFNGKASLQRTTDAAALEATTAKFNAYIGFMNRAMRAADSLALSLLGQHAHGADRSRAHRARALRAPRRDGRARRRGRLPLRRRSPTSTTPCAPSSSPTTGSRRHSSRPTGI